MNVIDCGLSFISGLGPENKVRFWVESRTRIIDDESGAAEDFYQCASCKAENTFAERDLFKEDNYDFLPIFGPQYTVIFRRHAYTSDTYRSISRSKERWGGQIYHIKKPAAFQVLSTNGDIRKATAEGLPIVSQTEIWNEQTGMRAVIECPVKTMNVNDERDCYQVDTGPVAFPDLTKRYERMVDAISLAFVAYNVPHFADFVIEAPTPIVENGREVTRVFHYSQIRSLPARNTLFCEAVRRRLDDTPAY